MFAKLSHEFAQPTQRDQGLMRKLISTLCWVSAGIWLLLWVGYLASGLLDGGGSSGLLLFFGVLLTIGAAVCFGVNALTQHQKELSPLLLVSLALTFVGMLLYMLGVWLASSFRYMWGPILFMYLFPLLCFGGILAEAIAGNKHPHVVRWVLLGMIALYLFYLLCIAVFVMYGGGAGMLMLIISSVNPVLATLIFWAALLLYWLYMPVYPCFRKSEPIYYGGQPQNGYAQNGYSQQSAQPAQPPQPNPQAEKYASIEKTLSELKRRFDAGEIAEEEYNEEKEKLLSMF